VETVSTAKVKTLTCLLLSQGRWSKILATRRRVALTAIAVKFEIVSKRLVDFPDKNQASFSMRA
jgi:hypothetical protein